MKKLLLVGLSMFVAFYACSKEEKNFEVMSSEAFAYALEEGWELNASANIAGFKQVEEQNGEYSSKISYSIHLVTPQSDTLYEADYGYIDRHEEEELMDIQIDSQMEVDSSFGLGKYLIIFEITDDYSGKTISATDSFELTAE